MKIEIENIDGNSIGDYESVRFFLLKNNFVVKNIVKVIKKQWGPWPHNKNPIRYKRYRNNAIQIVTGLLNIDIYLFQALITNKSKIPIRNGDIKIISLYGLKINQPGIYARYNPNMKKEDWIKLFTKIKEASKKYSKFVYPEIKKEIFEMKKIKRQVGYEGENKNIKMYLEVEKRIPRFWIESQKGSDKDLFGGPGEESIKSSVVQSAIENILELKKLKNQKYEIMLSKRYHDIYYRITRRYQLPTHEELNKFLQIINTFSFNK